MADLSRFRFFLRAIWADIKQSRRWKIITICYALLAIVRVALWFVTKWSPADLIAPWSWGESPRANRRVAIGR